MKENKKLIGCLELFAKEAKNWFGDKGTYELVNKYYSFNKNFFTRDNLKKAEWQDFQKIIHNLHSLHSFAIAGAKAFGKPNHDIAYYREQFLNLLDETKSISDKYDKFKIAYFGEGALHELFGYLFPETCYIVNSRTIEALKFFNISISSKGKSKGEKYIEYISVLNDIKKLYKEIVQPKTNLPINLEVDQFINWLVDTQITDVKGSMVKSKIESVIEDKETKTNIPLNQILFGPPGTGKTYNTVIKALEIVGDSNTQNLLEEYKSNQNIYEKLLVEFKRYKDNGQVKFITFHQNYSYEEFIEGISPNLDSFLQSLSYKLKDGPLKEIASLANSWKRKIKNFSIDKNNIKVYKMALFNPKEGGSGIYDYCIQNNKIAIGYGGDLNFISINTEEHMKTMFKDKSHYPDIEDIAHSVYTMNMFKNIIRKDDIVVINDGLRKISAIGIVKSDYKFDNSTDISFNHFRDVEWIFKDLDLPVTILQDKNFGIKTIYPIKTENIKDSFWDFINSSYSKTEKKFVLIIDEINRGNISKIFGELITLLEEDKRIGNDCAMKLPLMYSQKEFGLPNNLYIIGTMNTADKSIALVDIALRRRFKFFEMMPKAELLPDLKINNTNLKQVFINLNKKISVLVDRDHQIGHSYFMKVKTIEDLKKVWDFEILPLLNEYFYGDWEKMHKVIPDFIDKQDNNTLLEGQSYYTWKQKYNFEEALGNI